LTRDVSADPLDVTSALGPSIGALIRRESPDGTGQRMRCQPIVHVETAVAMTGAAKSGAAIESSAHLTSRREQAC
jgi:hypothetical protein